MFRFPEPVVKHLLAHQIESRSPAYLLVDKSGLLQQWGGDVALYGIDNLQQGATVHRYLDFLSGFIPLQQPAISLEFVATRSGVMAHLYMFTSAEGDWLVLLDARADEARLRPIQQRKNELELQLEGRGDPMEAARSDGRELGDILTTGLGVLVLEQIDEYTFRHLADPPAWTRQLGIVFENRLLTTNLAEKFPVVQNFLEKALSFWHTRKTGRIRSIPWCEQDESGKKYYVSASAVCVGARNILLLQHLAGEYAQLESVLQSSREQNLRLRRVLAQLQEAEGILLDAIDSQE